MTAESFLSRLADRGVEYVLANAGTDFAPIIEALSRHPGSNRKYPRVITVPHENLPVAVPALAPGGDTLRHSGASAAVPSSGAVDRAAAILSAAEFPLILTSSAGRNPAAMAELAALAEEFAIPVVQSEARDISLPTDHPMCLGFDPAALLAKADAVAVFDSAVPWIPRLHPLKPDAKIICFGPDPLFTRYPFREFEADLLVTGESGPALTMLRESLSHATLARTAAIEARRKALGRTRHEMIAKRKKLIAQVKDQTPIHPLYLAHCLNELKAKDAIIVNELGLPVGALDLTTPRSYLGSSLAGGLGVGLGGGPGAKLAAPEREVIAAVGDCSYYLGHPLSFPYMAHARKTPPLTIIPNNHAWHAVRQAARGVYPDRHAAHANHNPL